LEKCLVTVAILSYNNLEFLGDAIDSVLVQDYPNIELIISDDGTADFEKEKVLNYIVTNKKENIKKIIINDIKENGGTSKNFNSVLKIANGKYIKYLAADDLFYKETSLSSLVDTARSKDALVVAGRCPCYDKYLEQREWTYPSDADWERIINASKWDLFGIMSEYCLISAPGVLYQKDFLIQQGGADEKYPLIEDWPFWMKMIRSGYEFAFLNKPVVIYRKGGVSNGIENLSYGIHQLEYAQVIKDECLKYKKNMKRKHYWKSYRSEKRHRYNGIRQLYWNQYSHLEKIKNQLFYLDVYIYDNIVERAKKFFHYLNQSKNKILILGMFWMIIAVSTNFKELFSNDLNFLATFLDWKNIHLFFLYASKILMTCGIGIYIIDFCLNIRTYIGKLIYR
jgi:glycosyltransferase involved in cell wall biosynthesis